MIYLILIASLFSSPKEFTLIIDGEKEQNLAKTEELIAPQSIELRHEKRLKVTYAFSKGGRKLLSQDSHTNEVLKLNRVKDADNLSITIYHPKRKIMHHVKLLKK